MAAFARASPVLPSGHNRSDSLLTGEYARFLVREPRIGADDGTDGGEPGAYLGDRGAYLLVRRHLKTGELAYCYCYVPEGQPVTKTRLIRAAGLRWPVEEGFEFGRDCFG